MEIAPGKNQTGFSWLNRRGANRNWINNGLVHLGVPCLSLRDFHIVLPDTLDDFLECVLYI